MNKADAAKKKALQEYAREIRSGDRKTLFHLQRAADSLERAQKAMPNSITSVFDEDDAKRLAEIMRQVAIIRLAEPEGKS